MSNWYDSLPSPQSNPPQLTPAELSAKIENEQPGKDFIVVDVRRTDMEGEGGYVIARAINLPAQTFHQTLPSIVSILKLVPCVIFHCSSSAGRGPRCAGWYQDALDAEGITSSRAYVLHGGLKAVQKDYPELLLQL